MIAALRISAWRPIGAALSLFFTAACGSTTEPVVPASPTVVPAGAADAAWAVIGKSCSGNAAVTMVHANKRDSLPPFTHGPFPSSDDEWADAARVIPGGWGGLILENGVPTIFLVDPTKRDGAIAAMRVRDIGTMFDLSKTIVKAGRWNFSQLAEWYRYLDLHTPGFAGLQFADINESRNRIEFTVTSAAARTAIEAKLVRMDLPCYLVAINAPA
jgi:hypothetical protein